MSVDPTLLLLMLIAEVTLQHW